MSDLAEQKQQLRQHCRAIRKSLGEEARKRASQIICERIEGWKIFQQSDVVLAYMPIKSEVDLTSLFARYPQKCWALPRIIPEENNRMVFHPYAPDGLVEHPFGMAEPAPHLPVVQPIEIQLVLAPGLAFDRLGWRLGYGGGYFDRFLENFTGVSAGIVFHALLLDSLPHGEFDQQMQWIITEEEMLNIKTGGQ
jgi:5-formyltetrahydrofolate cyclo-ligase